MPVPITTAMRLGSRPVVMELAMLQASRAAARASWAQRSERRQSIGGRLLRAPIGTQPASRTGRSSVQGV